MAGRPFSAGGQTGLLYGVVCFAIISAASLGLFVFQLTKNKAAQNEAQIAKERLNKYVGKGTPPTYYLDEASSRKTNAFAVMSDDLAKLANLVTGSSKDLGPAVLAKSEQALAEIAARQPGTIRPGEPLLATLARLSEAHSQAQAAEKALAAEVKRLQEANASLTAQLQATRDQFEDQVATLSAQLARVQQEQASAMQQKDVQLRDLQTMLDAREQQLARLKREGNKAVQERDLEVARLENSIKDLQDKIRAIKPETFDPNAILTSADGRIVRAIPGSQVVYINLGAVDQMKPGLGFEVYAPTREPTEGLRGKASIEVVTVMERTAECRVTRSTPGQPIMEGDILVNIAYERNRKPKFVVRGDFDLDYDGTTDYNGVEQISSLIQQWGGQVVENLDESVDFMVVGLPPVGPSPGPNEKVSEIVRDQVQTKELERSRFRAEIERAQKLFIPVITQNQFLFLTGYAGGAAHARR